MTLIGIQKDSTTFIFLISFIYLFQKERKKRSEGEEEIGRKRGRENRNVALF